MGVGTRGSHIVGADEVGRSLSSRLYWHCRSFCDRFQLLWDSYIDWGVANPMASKAVNQLGVSLIIKPETHARTNALEKQRVFFREGSVGH